jgi:hypothetical protein
MKIEAHSGPPRSPRGLAFGLLLVGSCSAADHVEPMLEGVSGADASLESPPTADAETAEQDAVTAEQDARAAEPDAKAAQPTDAAPADANPSDAARSGSGPISSAKLKSDEVVLSIGAGPLYFMTCTGATKLEKPDGSGWTSLRDDHASIGSGFFLDGNYIPPQINPGCDFSHCSQVTTPFDVGPAFEYVQKGTRPIESNAPPVPAGIVAANPAPDIKTQPYTGRLRVTLIYARDAQCTTRETAQIEIEVPSGSCCPVSSSCSSTNAGGWAASPDECRSRAFRDGYFTAAKDVHGCDVLRTSTSSGAMCCGCAMPATGP